MIIDNHTHINNKKSLNSYKKNSKKIISKIISIPWYKKTKDQIDIEDLLKFISDKPNIYALGAIDMDKPLEKQLSLHEKLLKDKKIVGIKLYPGYQYFYPSDPKVFEIARLCEKYNKPLVFHNGDFYDPEDKALLKYSHPIHIDELANKCPNTKIIISHFGFPYHMETANIISKNKNVFTDISGTIDNCGSSKKDLINLTTQYISDLKRVFNYYPHLKLKTMFGTDYSGEDTPLNQVQSYIDVIKKIMNKQEQKNAFHLLAEKIYF